MLTPYQQELFETHKDLAYWCIYSGKYIKDPQQYAKTCGVDIEDLEQIAMMYLLLACQRYDPEKTKFSTYAVSVIYRKILKVWRETKRYRTLQESVVSLDEPISKESGNNTFIEYLAHGTCVEDLAIANIEIDRLQPRDRKVLQMYLDGYTQKEIAASMDISQPHVGRLLKKSIIA